MKIMSKSHVMKMCAVSLILSGPALAAGTHEHSHEEPSPQEMIETMRGMHADHEHAHDFEAMSEISEEDMDRTMSFLVDIGLVVPPMDSERGADVFMNKGCVACHSVNGVGGEIGPPFDAEEMPQPMNAFEFAARMWRGAPAMAQMQEDLLGDMITLNGQELADVIAFVHDDELQDTIDTSDVPSEFRKFIR